MNTQVAAQDLAAIHEDADRGHNQRLLLAWGIAVSFILVVAGYGYDYYILSAAERPFSPKHDALRPSGTLGMKLGMLGVLMFFIIYLYPLRKKWGWLARKGNSRHWLDFHVLLGATAPVIVAFHSSFKFGNIAGMAFWSMLAVTMSGFVGRYLYAQIPRRLNAAELTLKEMQDLEAGLIKQLEAGKAGLQLQMDAIFALPTPERVAEMSTLAALVDMIAIDLKRPFQVSLLRLRGAGFGAWILSFFGLFPTRHANLENAVRVARKQAAISKRVLFLSRTQRVFKLWHIVHYPFSYGFAILAIAHIALVLVMGYRL
jgi:hypothetical protein